MFNVQNFIDILWFSKDPLLSSQDIKLSIYILKKFNPKEWHNQIKKFRWKFQSIENVNLIFNSFYAQSKI
jgi:hypothetical protein